MLKYLWSLINNERGNVSFGTSTQKRKVAAASPQEQAIANANAVLAQKQAEDVQRQLAEQQAYAQTPQGQMDAQLLAQAQQNLMGGLNGQALNPAQQALINQYYGAQQKLAEQNLRTQGDEIAGRRGMALSDSPIGNDYLRALGDIQTSFGGQRAGAMLNQGNTNQNMALQLAQFQQGLRQQNAQNRLSLSQATTSGLPLQNILQQGRIASAPVTSQGFQGGLGLTDIGKLGLGGYQLAGGNNLNTTKALGTAGGYNTMGYTSKLGG